MSMRLLGPGMNIHRNPLNGRNFEYISEDPYLTGWISAVQILGMEKSDVTGTIKHFCGNNQESKRHHRGRGCFRACTARDLSEGI